MVDDDSGLSGGGLLAAAEVVEVVMLLMMTEPERERPVMPDSKGSNFAAQRSGAKVLQA